MGIARFLYNKIGSKINPATADKQDEAVGNQTDGDQKTQIVNESGQGVDINSSGQMHVVLMGKVDAGNSSATPLGIDGVFTGTSFETLDYGFIFVTVFSDVASAVDGLLTQISSDGITWRDADKYTIPAGTEKTYAFQPNKKFFRIKYTNGGTEQATFDLHSVFKKTSSLPSSHRIQDSISDEDDAQLVTNVNKAKNPDGTFVNIGATKSNNLKVANVEDGLSIAKGDVANTIFVHKFGNAGDIDTADNFVDIWDGTEDANADKNYTYSTSADIDKISSSDNGDTQDIEIQGLDTNYDLVIQTVTLTGQTKATLGTPLIRVFRMINRSSDNIAGAVYCYVDGTITTGVPQTNADIRAIINNGNNQTLMALYTIPNGKTGYMRDFYGSLSKKQAATSVIKLFSRPFGEVFHLKHISSIASTGSSRMQHKFEEPEVFTEKTDIALQADTSADSVGVGAGFDIVLVDN